MQRSVGRSRAVSPEGEPAPAAAWDVTLHPVRDQEGRIDRAVQVVRAAAETSERGVVSDDDDGSGSDGVDELSSLRRRLERMTALDKLKSDFMNLTTHELRSPLAIVYGYLSMMESGMLGDLSAELREAVASSIQSVELMMQLVTELVEMARLDETRLDPTREPVDLTGVVAEAAFGSRPPTVIDSTSISAPARPRCSGIGAAAPGVRQHHRQRTEVLAVGWRDRGADAPGRTPGRGRRDRPGPGHRPLGHGPALHAVRPDRDHGHRGDRRHRTGLYLCRELVRRLGGDVTATSVEGEGSTFTVHLPAAPAGARARLAS